MNTSGTGDTFWQDSLSVKSALQYMLEKSVASDVTFKVGGEEEEISSHKFMLIARSHVFQQMFESPISEDVIVLPDVETEDFQNFMRFIYTDEVELTGDNVMALLYLSRKYMIRALSDECQNFLIKANLYDPENAVTVYQQAFMFDMKDIMADSMKTINQSTKQCMESEAFLNLNQACMKGIISDDRHEVAEEDLYRCILKWGERECERRRLDITDKNIRNALGDALYEIRFCNMNFHFFDTTIRKKNILTDDEKNEVISLLTSKNTLQRRRFNCRKRATRDRLMRMLNTVEDLVMCEYKHSIEIESGVDCHLHGIVTYGLSQSVDVFNINVRVLNEDELEIMNSEFMIDMKGSSQVHDVLFQKAITVRKDKKYVIEMTLDDTNWMWTGQYGQHTMQFKGSEFKFRTVTDSDTTAHDGQIPGLILS